MHYKSSWACVTHISQESENNGIFVGWPLLVSLIENPQNGVEWFRPVGLFEMNQRNVALCLACSLRLLPSAPASARLNTLLWTLWLKKNKKKLSCNLNVTEAALQFILKL